MPTPDEQDRKPVTLTGKQDLGQALASGWLGAAWGLSGFGGGTLTSGTAAAAGMSAWTGGPLAATQGSGTFEGTNKYSPAPFFPGGAVPFPGLIPGFGPPWPGTYATYRVMMAHPTLVLAMAAVVAPVVAGEWAVEETAKGKAPAKAKEYVETVLLPQRHRVVAEMLKALAFGCRGFERVKAWKTVGNRRQFVLDRLKPLLPELTEVRVDAHGEFAGLRNVGVDLGPDKAVLYTYDRDGDNHYGRPRMENCRRAWSNWLCVDDNLYRLGTKAASIIPYVGYPEGEGQDADGKTRSNYEIATSMAQGMAAGRGVVFPNWAGLAAGDLEGLLRNLPEIAKASLWHHGTIDMGNSGPAQEAMLKHLQYYDMLLVRGWMQPERSLLEATKSGSRADSEEHGDQSTQDCDLVHVDVTDCVNEQVLDREIADNFGPEAVGTVRLKAVPLVDEKKLVDGKLYDAICKNPSTLVELIDRLDMDAWLDRSGLPRDATISGPWEIETNEPDVAGNDDTPPNGPAQKD
jgi:hypothetical protein